MTDEDVTLTVTCTVQIVDPLALREAGFRAIREDNRLSVVSPPASALVQA